MQERLKNLGLPSVIIPPAEDVCIAPLLVSCDISSKYRKITGRCNNLQNLEMGMCLKPFRRRLKPMYEDGEGPLLLCNNLNLNLELAK